MVKSELYSNLKQAIDMLDGLLIPEGSKELSYWGSEEDELNLLQEEISALDYSCLDEVYHGGLKEVINDNLSPAENALISGVGLLDEYGLSEEEFREWLEKQPEVYSLLLGILITGKWPDYSQWKKMEDYFEEEYRQELFDPANINISPKSGIRFAEEKPEDGSQSFYYLQKVIVFDKSFDAYNGVARELKPILQEARKFYLDKQAEALNNPGACGDHFYETMLTFAQAFKEAQESILRATTSGLRRRSVKADVIQNFRLKYREIAQESCRDFLHVFEHMIELYEQFYPEKEQGRHEYIDYISALRSGQRNLEIAVSDLSQFQKNALYTANKAATSAVNRFANSFMDSAHASKEQRAFAEKLKAVFDTEQYERAIDMIFRAFGDNVDIEYTDSLGIETDILVSAQQEKNICEELVDIFDQGSIDKNTIAEFLKTYTMQYPYDANLYAIAYLYFGSGAGDLEDITKYLGIYDSFVDCAKEICIFKLKYQMNLDMEGNNLEQLEADVQFAKRLVKKYALLQTELEPYAIRMQSELGGKKYTATHPKEETQCFYKIMADKQLTKGDALYLKGSEEFEKYYAKYAGDVDQEANGPIAAFYSDFLAFTPEKLYCIIRGKDMDDDTVAVDYDELKLSGYTVMTLPDEDRMSGNVCELGTYRFGYSGDCDFLRHLKFWSATKKVKKLLAELPENETWDIPAMENNETIIKLLRVLVDNFNIELYKNLYTREIENNTENGRCMFMSHDIKCSQADYFTEPEISRLLKILSPLDKSTLEELLIDPKERAAKRAKTAAERKEFMDFWSAESLEKHLQNPDVNISALAKIECYLYKALDDRMGDISECQNYYSLYTEAERDVAQKKVNFICTWIKEHPLDFDWTDEMEEANQQVQYQIYANKMLSYLKKNASAKEQFDTAVRFAIQYDVVDENNNVVTSYEPKIKFTMSLLANLELKIIFGTVPDALECHSYEEAVEHRNQFYEIVKKYSLGEVTGNQCVLNKMYDDMFAQKESYAFYIQWLNNEFPSEVEYQKKLQETKGLKKILVMATKPNHLATIE